MPNLLDLLSQAGMALDAPGAMFRNTLAGRNPLRGIADDEERTSGRELLEMGGWLDPNEDGLDWGDAAGLGVEVLADPLNLLGTGLLTKALHGKRLAAANKEARKFFYEMNAKNDLAKATGGMPVEALKHTVAKDAMGNPIPYYHGTPHVFDKFDLSKADPNGLKGPGVYLTDNPGVASTYPNKGAKPWTYKWSRDVFEGTDEDLAEEIALFDDAGLLPRYSKDLYPGPEDYRKAIGERLYGDKIWPESLFNVADGESDSSIDLINTLANGPYFNFDAIPGSPMNVRKHFLDVRNPFDIDKVYPESALPERLRSYLAGEDNLKEISGDDLYHYIDATIGYDKSVVNSILRDAGYDAIRHRGGQIMGDTPHDVFVMLDPNKIYSPWTYGSYVTPPMPYHPVLKPSPLVAALGAHNAAARGVPRFME